MLSTDAAVSAFRKYYLRLWKQNSVQARGASAPGWVGGGGGGGGEKKRKKEKKKKKKKETKGEFRLEPDDFGYICHWRKQRGRLWPPPPKKKKKKKTHKKQQQPPQNKQTTKKPKNQKEHNQKQTKEQQQHKTKNRNHNMSQWQQKISQQQKTPVLQTSCHLSTNEKLSVTWQYFFRLMA